MPSTIEDTRHFFLPMQGESPEQTNRRVATEFCNAFQRQFDVAARLVTVGDQTGPPDAVIEIGGERVVLELTGYRQRDEYRELEARESQVRSALADSLQQSGAPPFSIRINWTYERRRKRKQGMPDRIARVPRGPDQQSFANEIDQLIRFVQGHPCFEGKNIVFRNRETVAAFRRHAPDKPILESAEYPALARFCSSITLSTLSLPMPPSISSSFDSRWVAADFGEIERVVGTKLNKLANYRIDAKGKKVWLVLYADGMPPSTWTNEAERDKVFKLILQTAVRSDDPFDAIWWAEETRFVSEARIWHLM